MPFVFGATTPWRRSSSYSPSVVFCSALALSPFFSPGTRTTRVLCYGNLPPSLCLSGARVVFPWLFSFLFLLLFGFLLLFAGTVPPSLTGSSLTSGPCLFLYLAHPCRQFQAPFSPLFFPASLRWPSFAKSFCPQDAALGESPAFLSCSWSFHDLGLARFSWTGPTCVWIETTASGSRTPGCSPASEMSSSSFFPSPNQHHLCISLSISRLCPVLDRRD